MFVRARACVYMCGRRNMIKGSAGGCEIERRDFLFGQSADIYTAYFI